MPKKAKSSLSVKKLPPELLGRVNAKAALLGKDTGEFVIECLEKETKELKPVQDRIKQDYRAS